MIESRRGADKELQRRNPGEAMKSKGSGKDLDRILAGVSRSFFLTLRIAPRALRRPLALGYLFCRAADTIADTRALPVGERLECLEAYRRLFGETSPADADLAHLAARVGGPTPVVEEGELMRRLGDCLRAYGALSSVDRRLLSRLVRTLTGGMQMDLRSFPPEESGRVAALASDEDLDRYCYLVAGCVGEFWTDLQCAHLSALSGWDVESKRAEGIRFGKGLQMTNILRDVDGDLRLGRCYLPAPRLERCGLRAEDLAARRDRGVLRPLVHDLMRSTLDHYDVGWRYTLSIPRRLPRLRLACAWPLLIGLGTLERLARLPDPCAPGAVTKITRREVRGIVASSGALVFSQRALDRLYQRAASRVRDALGAGE